MTAVVLTIWLCAIATPKCPIDQSTMTPVVKNMDDNDMCEAIAREALTVLPPPKGTVARYSCTQKEFD